MTKPQALEALSEHAISHAIDMARGESHKQGDAAFHRAFARALWRQWTAQTAAPQPEAQASPAPAPLSEAEISDLWDASIFEVNDLSTAIDFVRDVERAHGIGLDGGM